MRTGSSLLSPPFRAIQALRTVVILAGITLAAAAGAPALAAAKAEKSGDNLVLQNDLVKLTIALKSGARVSEFVYQPFGDNIVYPVESAGGLLMDHVWEQTWPGEFLNRPYESEIVNAGPAEATVKVWTTGKGDTVKDLRVERVITLKDGDRAVYVKLTLANPSAEGRVTGYWSQNNYWFGGKKEGMTWARPAVRGIDRLGLDAKGEQWQDGAWFYVDDSTAGWNAGFNKDLKRGMMFLMDYNDLWRLYDNVWAVTTEWMYDRAAIPAGKSWSTAITIIPVSNISGFTHGSANAVANFQATQTPEGLTIEHQVAKGVVPLKNVTINTRVWGLKKRWTATVPEAKFAELTDAAQSQTVKATGMDTMPAGIEVTLTGTAPDGKTATETYGDYFGGAEGKNNDPFSMKPYLAFNRPVKQKAYLKPDVIEYKPNADPKVLCLRGLWTDFFRVAPALSNAFPKVTIQNGWLEGSPVGLAFTYFPPDYPSLMSRDLVVLGNVPAAPLDLVGQEMLQDYLGAGGNVLMLGGDQAFGQAGFANSNLLAMIPLDMGGEYNWRKIPGGGVLKLADAAHPIAQGVAFGKNDVVLYSHLCTPTRGATVVVTAGDRPILVLGTTAKGGRIACVLATPFGEAARGQTAFWDAPAWSALMQNTARWLIRRP